MTILEIEDKSNLKIIRKNDVLLYLGNRNHFKSMFSSVLQIPDDAIDRTISQCTSGIILQKGSKAFDDNEIKPNISEKVSFAGHFGHIHCVKDESDKKNHGYFRIIKDSAIEAICMSNNTNHSTI
jgi:hypothetical protein